MNTNCLFYDLKQTSESLSSATFNDCLPPYAWTLLSQFLSFLMN